MQTRMLSRQNVAGLAVILVIPVFLWFIFILPSGVKVLLILHSDSLNVFAFFACHFVHEDFANHLSPNIFAYFVAILLLYFALSKLNEKRLFYRLFAFNLLAMPFILSLSWIGACTFWGAQTRSLGFSGINSAFFGAFIFAYALFLHETLKVDMFYANLSAIFFTALIFTLKYSTLSMTATAAIVIALLAAFGALAYKTVNSVDPQAKVKLREKIKNPKIAVILAKMLLYLLIFAFNLILFPTQIVQGNVMINIFIHYTGFVFGIGTAQLIWQARKPQQKP